MVDGAEAELAQAAGVTGIPIELFDVPEVRSIEDRADHPGARHRRCQPGPDPPGRVREQR